MSFIHLVLGGARSGKSSYAETLAKQSYSTTQSSLIYLATATAGDKEMSERISHHQARRNSEWQLYEEEIEIATIVKTAPKNSTVLIDCLTLWLSNCLHNNVWPQKRSEFIDALSTTSANIVMVSNEVGSGIVPMGELSRKFVDESGWLHQQIAATASHVTLVVAGLEMPLKRPMV